MKNKLVVFTLIVALTTVMYVLWDITRQSSYNFHSILDVIQSVLIVILCVRLYEE